MKYLIVKYEPLNDGWECDANRIPITMVDDWRQWEKDSKPQYDYEVYKLSEDNIFECLKEWEED